MNNIFSTVCRIFLLAFFVFASACNTVPSSSSSSSSGSPPSGSPPSGSSSSSSSSSGSSSSSQSGSQSGSAGNEAGQQGASSRAGAKGKGSAEAQADANTPYGKGEKSDDEILADALGEFDKKLNESQVDAEAQGQANKQQSGNNAENEQGQANQQQTGSSAGGGQGTMTEEERTGKLDEQLNRKFAKFDDLMLGERETVAKDDNESGSAGGNYGMEDGQGDGDDPLQTAMANPQPPRRGGGMKGDRQTEDLPPAPSDVGDGQDDDIIARQLREAASKEQDPELRARLWDEYRKYKKGA